VSGPALLSLAKALVEIALCLLAARGALFLLLGGNPERLGGNLIYGVFEAATAPLLRPFARLAALLPRPFSRLALPVLLLCLATLWCALVLGKWQACQQAQGDSACPAPPSRTTHAR
jgi:hypothetical protein